MDPAPMKKSEDFVASYTRASAFDLFSYGLFRSVIKVFSSLPLSTARSLGRELGRVFYKVDFRWKKDALQRIQMAIPDKNSEEILRKNYEHLGMVLAELAHYKTFLKDPGSFFLYEGEDLLKEVKKGGIIISAHIGNWELLSLGHGIRFGSLAAVVRPIKNRFLYEWITEVRKKFLLYPVLSRYEAFRLIRLLKEGWLIVFLLDQNSLEHEGIYVPFFGKVACTHYGPFLLSERAKVPVISAFGVRTEDGRFSIRYEPPIAGVGSDLKERIYFLTKEATRRIESWIRIYPEQWFWVHNRYRTRPSSRTVSWKNPSLKNSASLRDGG